MALSDADRIRLARLLGMLGSDHVGERANAGALADKLIRERGLTCQQVVTNGLGQQHERHNRRAAPRTWRTVVDDCRAQASRLTPWESRFLESVARWRGVPTSKQQLKLRDIAERLGVEVWQ